ncbi:hypothetical protein [Ralstonia pseudosolanacearum]|uniref:hypothetical protein n=1 Tax=Ralstonia pseudosolanacearum TaxID=1310165 RepID=UPI0013157F9E|nr:hypothetical protein [Ralstonia pseudosolanacearum]QWF10335.1 hypothetical protein KME70_09715 [Ralstonia solanacearum]
MREKISITLPREMRQQLEREQREMSQRAGCNLTLSQTAQALLQRALTAKDFPPAAG